jgi:hypothetical protein
LTAIIVAFVGAVGSLGGVWISSETDIKKMRIEQPAAALVERDKQKLILKQSVCESTFALLQDEKPNTTLSAAQQDAVNRQVGDSLRHCVGTLPEDGDFPALRGLRLRRGPVTTIYFLGVSLLFVLLGFAGSIYLWLELQRVQEALREAMWEIERLHGSASVERSEPVSRGGFGATAKKYPERRGRAINLDDDPSEPKPES